MKMGQTNFLKRNWMRAKKWLTKYKFIIISLIGIFLFPIVATLFYKIPFIRDLNVTGDYLQFYAVVFGLLITCVQYRNAKKEQRFLAQQASKPKFSIKVTLDNDEKNTKIEIINHTGNDYKITYIYHDYYEGDKTYYIDGNGKIECTIDSWADYYPEMINIQLEDFNGNNWSIGFEKQEDTTHYYRSFIDAV